MASAIAKYYEAYLLNLKQPKILHCIGAWYRKWLHEKFPYTESWLKSQQKLHVDSKKDKKEIMELLLRAAYWYRLEQANNGGRTVDWLVTISKRLRELTEGDGGFKCTYEQERTYQEELKEAATDYKKWREETKE